MMLVVQNREIECINVFTNQVELHRMPKGARYERHERNDF